jgi:hypothetical protein
MISKQDEDIKTIIEIINETAESLEKEKDKSDYMEGIIHGLKLSIKIINREVIE